MYSVVSKNIINYGNRKQEHLEQDFENNDNDTHRPGHCLRRTILLWITTHHSKLIIMSNAILTSCQYQEYRRIDLIVIHCSATRATQRYTVDDCRRDHRARGFADIGYHYYITQDGVVHRGRQLYQVGAHATGYNRYSIGICYEGGLDIRGQPADTRTTEQKETLRRLIRRLKEDYPNAKVVGHRDLPGVKKACPCFEI